MTRLPQDGNVQKLIEESRAGVAAPLQPVIEPDPLPEQDRPSFGQTVGDAIISDTTIGDAMRLFAPTSLVPDPSFRLDDDDVWAYHTRDIPPAYQSMVAGSLNAQHAEQNRIFALDLAERRDRLQQAGIGGAVARISVSMLDPLALAIGAFAAPLTISSKASRLANMVRVGLVTGATEAAFETARANVDPEIGIGDIALTASVASLLGGGAGAIFTQGGRRVDEAAEYAREIQSRAELHDLEDLYRNEIFGVGAASPNDPAFRTNIIEARKRLAKRLSPEGRERYKDFLSGVADKRLFRKLLDMASDGTPDPEFDASLASKLGDDELADIARRASGHDSIVSPVESDLPSPDPLTLNISNLSGNDRQRGGVADQLLSALPFSTVDAAGRRVRGRTPGMYRKLIRSMIDDRIRPEGGVTTDSAELFAYRHRDRLIGGSLLQNDRIMKQWARTRGERVTPFNVDRMRAEFSQQLGQARVDAFHGRKIADPGLAKASSEMDLRYGELVDIAKRNGTPGYDEITNEPGFMPRFYDDNRMRNVMQLHGEEGETLIKDLIAISVRTGYETTNNLADSSGIPWERIAEAVFNRHVNGEPNVRINVSRLVDQDNLAEGIGVREQVRDILHQADVVDENQVDQILYQLTGEATPRISDRAKRRLLADHDTYVTLPDGSPLRFRDIIVTDADENFRRYTNQILGESAESRILQTFSKLADDEVGVAVDTAGLADDIADEPVSVRGQRYSSFASLRSDMARRLKEAGMRDSDIEEHIQTLDIARARYMGWTPPQAAGRGTRLFFERLRKIGQVRHAGKFAFAALGDAALIASRTNTRSLIRAVPGIFEMADILRNDKSGQSRDEVVKFLQSVTGQGYQPAAYGRTSRYDPLADEIGNTLFDRVLDKGSRLINTPLNIVDQRMRRIALRAGAQEFSDLAWSGRTPNAKKLAQMGLTSDQAKDIADDIKSFGTFNKSMRIVEIDHQRWNAEKPATMARFTLAMQQWTRTSVPEFGTGSLPQVFNSSGWQTMLQFRSHMIGTYTSLLRADLANNQYATAAIGAMTSGFFGALTYIAGVATYNPERAGELLAPGELVKVMVQRSAYSSIFPSAYDTLAGPAPFIDPVFTYRNSGLTSGVVSTESSPALSVFSDVFKSIDAISDAIDGSDVYTQKDLDRAARLLPFSSFPGVQAAARLAGRAIGLPEE